jgi:hypothetical protein
MRLLKQAVGVLGTLVVVVVIAALVMPKAAHGIVATLVQVVNTPANPVPNRDVDNPAFQPFQASCTSFFNGQPAVAVCNLPAVPNGQRLVIEMVGSTFDTSHSAPVFELSIVTNGSTNVMTFPVQFQTTYNAVQPGGGVAALDHYVSTSQARLYANPGTTATCQQGTDLFGIYPSDLSFGCSISGYLVNVP